MCFTVWIAAVIYESGSISHTRSIKQKISTHLEHVSVFNSFFSHFPETIFTHFFINHLINKIKGLKKRRRIKKKERKNKEKIRRLQWLLNLKRKETYFTQVVNDIVPSMNILWRKQSVTFPWSQLHFYFCIFALVHPSVRAFLYTNATIGIIALYHKYSVIISIYSITEKGGEPWANS